MADLTINDWERDQNIIFLDPKIKAGTVMNSNQFWEMAGEHNYREMNWPQREQWLKDNGHDVNRANMLDEDLPSKKSQQRQKSKRQGKS